LSRASAAVIGIESDFLLWCARGAILGVPVNPPLLDP
jgi:hypothetical protein